MEFEKEWKQRQKEAEEILEKFVPAEEGRQKTVIRAMNYSFLAGGKRLRPILMREVFEMFGGKGGIVEPFMAAIEMIHTYSLIHDDLPAMDNDDYRRGKKTNHVVFGENIAILAGDGLLNLAFETASGAVAGAAEPAVPARALAYLASCSGIYGMVGGQCVDVEMEGKPLDQETLDAINAMKTGALIRGAMCCGAILAGASEGEVRTVEKAASDIGLAFQIRDDILDVIGTQEELGKPAGSDQKNEKTTYVTLLGPEQSERDVRFFTERAVRALQTLSCENPFLITLIEELAYRKK